MSEEMSTVLNSYGVSASTFNLSWPNIMAWIIFGMIGMCAFNYGRKEKNYKVLGIGVVLMGYSYFVSSTLWLYVIGIAVSCLLYFWKD
jgi:hypothetical protein